MNATGYRELVALIWITMAIASLGVAIDSSKPEMVAIPIGVAVVMTVILVLVPDILAALTAQREKAKREPGDKLALLMEMMDEDERAAFKQALKRRVLDDLGNTEDGELPADEQTLTELLGEERVQRRAGR